MISAYLYLRRFHFKKFASDAGVPCVPGYHGEKQEPDFLYQEAQKIGEFLSSGDQSRLNTIC